MTDYELGIARAADEAEWMKRGYVAWLMVYCQEAADAIRARRLKPEGTYSEALGDATITVIELRDKARRVETACLFDSLAERINDIPDDPLDEQHCQRKDGRLPSTSRGYKETSHGTTTL